MKILAYVHGYFPNHNAGAEAMLHQILLDLKSRGHEIAVVTKNPAVNEYEGIPLYAATGGNSAKEVELVRWADFLFTHLDFTRIVVGLGKRYHKKVVHLVHNDRQLHYHKVISPENATLAIANSDWIKKTIKRGIRSIVVFPPTDAKRYRVDTSREYITLINMNEAKGGKMFWQLARIMPERKFLGVKGAYGNQIEWHENLPNVTILENTPEIQNVYSKSRIVLMPSSYESWGRVAMEASCSGIPVIAAPTPGLKESLGYSGVFAEHDDVAGWVQAIKMLDDKKIYDKYSSLTIKRSKEISTEIKKQLDNLEEKLLDILDPDRKYIK